jgi:ABC-type Zn uptake system ZnuABC Zn-binding protein ZnuA
MRHHAFGNRTSFAIALTLLATMLASGCGDDEAGAGAGSGVTVVATTTQVGDFVRNVGGGRVDVHQILQPNSDPHEYEPRPSDARAVAEAEVVFRSGGDLDEWLEEVLSGAGEDVPTLTMIDSVETIEGEGETDPHWWQDPRNAVLAVDAIREALVEADPDGRNEYTRNAAAYIERLRALDRSIAGCMERVPADQRKLVTTHDALGYYARRYDVEVIGALIPSLSTQAQASAKDTLELVEQIEREGANAIFPETSLNPKFEEAVAREAGVEVGDQLWADSLGPEGSDGETYLEAMASDTRDLVEGLSAGQVRCTPDIRRAG